MASNNAGANAARAKEFESAKGPFMPRTPPVTLKQTYNASNKVVEKYNSIMKKANEEVKKTLDALNNARRAANRQAAQAAQAGKPPTETTGGRRNRKTKGRKTKGRKSRARKTRSRK